MHCEKNREKQGDALWKKNLDYSSHIDSNTIFYSLKLLEESNLIA